MTLRKFPLLTIAATLLFAACATLRAETDPNAPIDAAAFKEKIRVACVGDSITAGSGTQNNNGYPAQLQRALGDKWDVKNFGVGGRTLMNKGDNPYQTKGKLKESLAFNPDVVIIMLGTNDTKPFNWKFKDTFIADYKDLVSKYQALETKPRIFVMLPCPVVGEGAYSIKQENLTEQMPMISSVAKDLKLGVIDIYSAMKGKDDLIPDRVHPGNKGAELMTQTIFKALTGKPYEGPSTVK